MQPADDVLGLLGPSPDEQKGEQQQQQLAASTRRAEVATNTDPDELARAA